MWVLPALLDLRQQGVGMSVSPGMSSFFPFFTRTKLRALGLASTIKPWTDLCFLFPVLLSLYQVCPLLNSRWSQPWVKTPCVMEKPCLPSPALIRPYNAPILYPEPQEPFRWPDASQRSKKFVVIASSMSFWKPLAGKEMFSFLLNQPTDSKLPWKREYVLFL